MRFTTIYQILAAAALSQALIIPSEITAEGVYEVVKKADGTEIHTKIANVTSGTPFENDHALNRRYQNEIWCGCGYYMDPGNCDAAVTNIRNQLNQGNPVPAGHSFYAIQNNVVAFACNYGSVDFTTNGDSFGHSLESITNACGRYVAGSKDTGFNGDSFIVGYMQYSNGIDFCHDSTNSPQSSC
jgi:hypothetical protein